MVQLEGDYTPLVPLPPSATPVVHIKLEQQHSPLASLPHPSIQHRLVKFDGIDQSTTLDMDRHMTVHGRGTPQEHLQAAQEYTPVPVKDEPCSETEQPQLSGEDTNDSTGHTDPPRSNGPKNWTQQDMEHALDALKTHKMSLTKASATYGIPSTTLWQRAHRLGIDTPKKDGASKNWSETDLNNALHALRAGAISANKASKAYGIPSSTLYKIARREGIRLAAPFNAAPTAWRQVDLQRALHSIRAGHSVQRASTQFGIPTGTLYGRCKREGIELSRSNPTPWSEDAMGEAIEAVRVGQMSINQAAIHYNLPYSSLYGRFKRCKYDEQPGVSHQHHLHQETPIPMHHPTPDQHHEVRYAHYAHNAHYAHYAPPPPS